MSKKYLLPVLVCYLVAVTIRIIGITQVGVQTDEATWIKRSKKIITKFQDPATRFQATNHLGHPGIVPAFIVAAGVIFSEKINPSGKTYEEFDTSFNRFHMARIFIAAFSALIAPLTFILGLLFLGYLPALLAGLLIAIDPRHIGYSRLIHIDSVTSVFVLAAIICFVLAVKSSSQKYKLFAGIMWGLAVASKATAVLLLPCFFIYKLTRFLFIPKNQFQGERQLITWSDLGALIVGHITIALIWTRVWYHFGDFKVRLKIKSELAKFFWLSGKYLNQHFVISSLCIVILFAFAIYCYTHYKKLNKSYYHHLSIILGLLSGFLIILLFIPQVPDNFARFWTWVLGLKSTAHLGFGKIVPPTKNGYLDLFLSEMPTIALIGVLLALVFIFFNQLKSKDYELKSALVFLLTTTLIWILFLNTSTKQSWRYALPVVSLIYILVGFGYSMLLKLIPKHTHLCSVALIILTQLYATISWYPDYLFFFNKPSGGINAALNRKQGLFFAGEDQIINYIQNQSKNFGAQYITVFGDANALHLNAIRLFGEAAAKKMEFGFFHKHNIDYVISYSSHQHLIPKTGWNDILDRKPDYSFKLKGVNLANVYKVASIKPGTEITLLLKNASKNLGNLVKNNNNQKALQVKAKHDRNGYIYFDIGIPVAGGKYKLSVPVIIDDISKYQTTTKVLELKLGQCQHEFHISDFNNANKKLLELECDVSKGRVRPKVYWFGKVSLSISNPIIN